MRLQQLYKANEAKQTNQSYATPEHVDPGLGARAQAQIKTTHATALDAKPHTASVPVHNHNIHHRYKSTHAALPMPRPSRRRKWSRARKPARRLHTTRRNTVLVLHVAWRVAWSGLHQRSRCCHTSRL